MNEIVIVIMIVVGNDSDLKLYCFVSVTCQSWVKYW